MPNPIEPAQDLAAVFRQRLRVVVFGIGSVMLAGVLGYTLIEGWPPFDALYMTVITLFTVGYGETHALSPAGRAFTVLLIVAGAGVVAYALSNLTAFFVGGELTDVLRRSRMQSRIDAMKDHYILCGAGHSGEVILAEMERTARPLVVIERAEAKFQALLARNVPAVLGDATADDVLRRAGIDRAQGLFAALGTDHENAFVVLTARGLNPTLRIVAEQVEEGVRDKLVRGGADAVVRPSHIGGLRMASEMVRPAVVGFLDSMMRETAAVVRIEEVVVPEGCPLSGRPLGSIKGGEGNAALVLAVRPPPGRAYLFNPPPEHPLQAGETLVVMGTPAQHRELAGRLGGR